MSTTAQPPATEADLLQMPKDGNKYELVDGSIVMSPAGGRHGEIAMLLGSLIVAFVRRHKLGKVFDSSTGFRLPTGNTRSPDVSFVSHGRFSRDETPKGFVPLAPDLAIEILSPDDSPRQVMDKVGEYLQAGVKLVWVVDPETRTAVAYRSLTRAHEIALDGALDGEDVLPGFRCPLSELFS